VLTVSALACHASLNQLPIFTDPSHANKVDVG